MSDTKKKSAPYLFGLLCLIPLVGALVGIGLILYGIFKYKDKRLVIIGFSGIMITVAAYGFLFYNLRYGKSAAMEFAKISQKQLNSLVNNIEYYKVQKGSYPDSLEQITQLDEMVIIKDPLLIRKVNKNEKANFQYEKIGDQYSLFSVGIDGMANTADDIYPVLVNAGNSKYGFIRKR